RRVAGDDDELGLRVARAEPVKRRREQVDADRGAGAQADPPGDDPPELLDELDAVLQLPQRAPGVGQQDLARLRRVGALAHALETMARNRIAEARADAARLRCSGCVAGRLGPRVA